ncbi:hypothetical protein DBZ36_18070 [Alginatibacterium sediminis]|uniref:Calcineurin-like phosphoesterase domain-containing protein n=1 Tax=Alginatibacterium sediminis TaxID=2164068 RepID=A0A420E6A1_9ALTE|nr:metallophosphoesterase [Alginatibacterium sediminis]RKF13679.1 hypothetical protein DBZ36_18070 [Alginatibacterium sediminis]
MIFKPRKQHAYVQPNTIGRDFIVGDLHGQLQALYRQLLQHNFDFDIDRVFCTGDLIGRGPNTSDVLNLLTEKWFFSVMGNHEQLFLMGFDNQKYWDVLIQDNGSWLRHHLHRFDILMRWKTLIEICMPLSFTIAINGKQIGITHASSIEHWGRLQHGDLSAKEVWSCLWSRPLKASYIEPIKQVDAVVHGHSPVANITQYRNRYWIDTYQANKRLNISLAACFLSVEPPNREK